VADECKKNRMLGRCTTGPLHKIKRVAIDKIASCWSGGNLIETRRKHGPVIRDKKKRSNQDVRGKNKNLPENVNRIRARWGGECPWPGFLEGEKKYANRHKITLPSC